MINTNSLEIFKNNIYSPSAIGLVSNNAYLSIVVTNNCQMTCSYCINSETDHTLELPIDKAIVNITELVNKYNVQEAIMLGGEPLLHSDLFNLIKRLRTETGLKMIRLTTNGVNLINNQKFIEKLVDPEYGIQGLNISFHNQDFMSFEELRVICTTIKSLNSNIKIRINANIWKNNLDNFYSLKRFLAILQNYVNCVDEVRLSNLIPKDTFSVNPKNMTKFIGLTVEEYNTYFNEICILFSMENNITLIENPQTLGFVRYVLIPTKLPIILNWNTSSTVSEQICENDIKTRKINTFKCLVNGEISLSWNESNIINSK